MLLFPDSSKARKCRPPVGGALARSGRRAYRSRHHSGDGWFTLQIAKLARHVTAIDIDGNLLEVARMRLTEQGVTNCDFVASDAYDVAKLVSKPADFVFMANVFHGVPDGPRLARAVGVALKPTGRFAIVNWHQRPREETTVLGEPRA
jgi:ubiquinone/menaquinone biosynthesis C-methylase UbiE